MIEVEGFVGGDTPSNLGRQEIAPVEAGPMPFAITIDPALVAKQPLYRVHVRIVSGTAGEVWLATTNQRMFTYAPVEEVVVEPAR